MSSDTFPVVCLVMYVIVARKLYINSRYLRNIESPDATHTKIYISTAYDNFTDVLVATFGFYNMCLII